MTKHLGIWCLVAVAACGSDGGGPVAAEDFVDELIIAACEQSARCGDAASEASCRASIDAAFLEEFADAIQDGSVQYDADKAGTCLDSIGGASCTFEGFHPDGDDPCNGVFTGTVPAGGACVVDIQCADHGDCEQTDPSCDPDVACCASTCVAGTQQESQVGGPCADDIHVCAADLYCKPGANTCAQQVTQEDAPCDDLFACANPMYCDVQAQTPSCVRAPATGEACDPTDLIECADTRDYCDATMKCVKRLAPGAACISGSDCVGYADCIGGQCTAELDAGAACDETAGPDCAGDLDCIGNVCVLPPSQPTCTL